jgi:hypothetical protein
LDYLGSENGFGNYQKQMHKRNIPSSLAHRYACPTSHRFLKFWAALNEGRRRDDLGVTPLRSPVTAAPFLVGAGGCPHPKSRNMQTSICRKQVNIGQKVAQSGHATHRRR